MCCNERRPLRTLDSFGSRIGLLGDTQIFCRRLAGASGHQFVTDLGALGEAGMSSLLNSRDVNEDVRTIRLRLDEPIALGCIEPLHCTHCHFITLPKGTI